MKLDLDSILDLEVRIPCRPDTLHAACVFLVGYLEDPFPPAEDNSQQCVSHRRPELAEPWNMATKFTVKRCGAERIEWAEEKAEFWSKWVYTGGRKQKGERMTVLTEKGKCGWQLPSQQQFLSCIAALPHNRKGEILTIKARGKAKKLEERCLSAQEFSWHHFSSRL